MHLLLQKKIIDLAEEFWDSSGLILNELEV